MSELPISLKEYNNAVLMSDFLTKIREYFETTCEIKLYRFVPKVAGYEINFEAANRTFIIQLFTKETLLSSRLEIVIIKDGKKFQNFISKALEDNEIILHNIIKLIN